MVRSERIEGHERDALADPRHTEILSREGIEVISGHPVMVHRRVFRIVIAVAAASKRKFTVVSESVV